VKLDRRWMDEEFLLFLPENLKILLINVCSLIVFQKLCRWHTLSVWVKCCESVDCYFLSFGEVFIEIPGGDLLETALFWLTITFLKNIIFVQKVTSTFIKYTNYFHFADKIYLNFSVLFNSWTSKTILDYITWYK